MVGHIPRATVAAYVDGELAPEDAAAVEEHLLNCRTCYSQALKQSETARLLRDWSNGRSDSGVVPLTFDRLRQQLEQQRATALASQARLKLPWLWAATILMTFLLIYGVQSLVKDLLATDRTTADTYVSAYVEDHLSFERAYRTARATLEVSAEAGD